MNNNLIEILKLFFTKQKKNQNQNFFSDLNNCDLVKIPDPIYFLLKDIPIIEIDLSDNKLEKIPDKIFTTFNSLRKLNVNNNKLKNLVQKEYLMNLKEFHIRNNELDDEARNVLKELSETCECRIEI